MVHKFFYWIIAAGLMLALILGGIIWQQKNNQELKVAFLDIGQGDAILISQGSNQMLIDGGKSGKLLLEKLGGHIPFWDRDIEIMLATHPDQDHIGGLVDVLRSYNVHKIIKTQAESESQTYGALSEEIKNENAEVVEAKAGLEIKFPNGAAAEIIFPAASLASGVAADSNAGSVVAKLDFGESQFLFTGDLPSRQEAELLSSGLDLKASVLKVAHHGSKYSTGSDFVAAVEPEEAVVSVGKKNSYGHPNQEVLNRLMKKGIKTWRTDEMGDIIYKCKTQSEKCKIIFE